MELHAIFYVLAGMFVGILVAYQAAYKRIRITAAQLIHTIREPWRAPREHGFQDFLRAMENNRIEGGHTAQAQPFLDRMNEIATYWQIGALSERDIKACFRQDITNLINNAYMQDILIRLHERDATYANLQKLLDRAARW